MFTDNKNEVNIMIVVFLFLDLSDVHSDDDEKENISPDDLPAIVPIDAFGESFEEAVSIYGYTVKPVLSSPVLSDHPLLSGQLSRSRKYFPKLL